MKTSKIFITALATAAVLTALPASAQSTRLRCLDVKNISDTSSRDGGETLTFKLRDGRTVVNRLMQKCDALRFGGFAWRTAPGGEICEISQTLRVLVTGEICRLGKFDTPIKSASR
jgi:hypothetical protein